MRNLTIKGDFCVESDRKFFSALTLSRLGGLSSPLVHFAKNVFFNFLILKSFKRKIKLSEAQFLSYQTHF